MLASWLYFANKPIRLNTDTPYEYTLEYGPAIDKYFNAAFRSNN